MLGVMRNDWLGAMGTSFVFLLTSFLSLMVLHSVMTVHLGLEVNIGCYSTLIVFLILSIVYPGRLVLDQEIPDDLDFGLLTAKLVPLCFS